MKILSKVSVKTVCNLPKSFFKNLPENGAETLILRIVGIVRASETGQSTFGEWIKFKGEFLATDLQTGEQSTGPAAFLPQPVDGMLLEALNGRNEADAGKPVEFGFDIGVIADPATEVGFKYVVHSLTETKPSNPLAALLANLSAPVLAVSHSQDQGVTDAVHGDAQAETAMAGGDAEEHKKPVKGAGKRHS